MLSVTVWRKTPDPDIGHVARLVSEVVGGAAPTRIDQAFDNGSGTFHAVYLVERDGGRFVLKPGPDAAEADVYRGWFTGIPVPVPALLAHVVSDGVHWLALEHVEGAQPRDPASHARAGASVAAVHAAFWGDRPGVGPDDRWERDASLVEDDRVGAVARELVQRAGEVGTTLGHGDLDPSNVLVSRSRSAIVDWGHAAPRPYFLDLARYCYLRGPDRQPLLNLQDRAAFLSSYRATLASRVDDDERFGRDVLLGQAALFLQRVAEGDEDAREDLFRVVHELS